MKVLVIQENGRHDANRKFRECFSLQRSFEKLGHVCDVWGLGHENYNPSLEVQGFESYDLIINCEQYDETGWVPSLHNVKNPKKFLWSVDAHCKGQDAYEEVFTSGEYDVLLHSTKDFVTKDYHRWFPNAFDDSIIKPLNVDMKYDLGFCGNYVNRRETLLWLENEYGLHLDIFVIGDAMVEAINSYKCHFNMNLSNDINYRSFETIGCSTLLLTNHNPQYDELGFVDGENCLMYKNREDLMGKIHWVIDNDVTNIVMRGHELSKQHTYDKRVRDLMESELC